ncbi:MAG TPA: hypothetical protein QF656_04110 [Nitrosopumilus sp.]|jgi:hypothetical protein|nr:hypothetical protein [Nitrosopumilus sp.]
MKKIFFILPILAFVIILLNGFFGHLLFTSPYDQDINKYSVYIHFQEEWNSFPSNILFEVTDVWSNPNINDQIYSTDFSNVSDFDYYNSNNLQFQDNRGYVELKHQFSDCNSSWKPMSYRYAIDSVRNQIELIQGTELHPDTYVSIFPNIKSKDLNYFKKFYAQFIPICTDKKITSYEYSISIDDENLWFDVYFIDSKKQFHNYITSEKFEFYTDDGCFGKNYNSFSGICENVNSESGLLILIPDNLNRTLTKIEVNLHEKI